MSKQMSMAYILVCSLINFILKLPCISLNSDTSQSKNSRNNNSSLKFRPHCLKLNSEGNFHRQKSNSDPDQKSLDYSNYFTIEERQNINKLLKDFDNFLIKEANNLYQKFRVPEDYYFELGDNT